MENNENKENTETAENKKGSFEARVARAKRALVGTILGTGLVLGAGLGVIHNQHDTIKSQENEIRMQKVEIQNYESRLRKDIDKKEFLVKVLLDTEASKLNMSQDIKNAVISDIISDIAYARTVTGRHDEMLHGVEIQRIPGNQPQEKVQRIPGNQPQKVVQSIPASKDFER